MILVRTNVSEEFIVSIIRVERICELGTTLTVTSNRSSVIHLQVTASNFTNSLILVTQMMEVIGSSEMLAVTRALRRRIQEDGILLELLLNLSRCYYIRQEIHTLFPYIELEPLRRKSSV
jgi:hypothetical protein